MASLEEIRNERLKKLNLLKEKGIDPYPIQCARDYTLKEVRERFEELSKGGEITLVGRVMLMRGQGALSFFNIFDGADSFQGLLKKDTIAPEDFELFINTVDIGDFVQVTGHLFITNRGEQTLEVRNWKMLSKSLRPLPEKWHGLVDVEERFRKRYLDVLTNPESRKIFEIRSHVISFIRQFLDGAGYLEVETPILQPQYGGASAEPFTTHHNALDIDLFLRISDELYLKRLLIAGFPKIYEISKNFRNEGIDVTHWPEFTMLEFYEAYSDANRQRAFVEEMMRGIAKALNPEAAIQYGEEKIVFSKKFTTMRYEEAFAKHANIKNILTLSKEEVIEEAKQIGANFDAKEDRVKIIDAIFKKAVRPHLIEPTFLVDYPVDYLPLTKRKDDNSSLVDAFQFYAGGFELVKAFSELNDPLEERERFELQEQRKGEGEKDAQRLDEDFLEAMEYGMPPTGGVGIGIDRLTMLMTNSKNIKDVILFPTMRSKK